MTREDLKKHWEVIEAFKNGAVIEYRPFPHDKWYETQEITLGVGCEYRIAKRDWAWACEMILAGNEVVRGSPPENRLRIGPDTDSIESTVFNKWLPVSMHRRDLLATDWRLA